jgi:hypothetical protein
MQDILEDKCPTDQENQRMNDSPDPAHRAADEALLKVAPHQLEQQTPAFHQVPQKKRSGQSLRQSQTQEYQHYQSLARVDRPAELLLQFVIRQL